MESTLEDDTKKLESKMHEILGQLQRVLQENSELTKQIQHLRNDLKIKENEIAREKQMIKTILESKNKELRSLREEQESLSKALNLTCSSLDDKEEIIRELFALREESTKTIEELKLQSSNDENVIQAKKHNMTRLEKMLQARDEHIRVLERQLTRYEKINQEDGNKNLTKVNRPRSDFHNTVNRGESEDISGNNEVDMIEYTVQVAPLEESLDMCKAEDITDEADRHELTVQRLFYSGFTLTSDGKYVIMPVKDPMQVLSSSTDKEEQAATADSSVQAEDVKLNVFTVGEQAVVDSEEQAVVDSEEQAVEQSSRLNESSIGLDTEENSFLESRKREQAFEEDCLNEIRESDREETSGSDIEQAVEKNSFDEKEFETKKSSCFNKGHTVEKNYFDDRELETEESDSEESVIEIRVDADKGIDTEERSCFDREKVEKVNRFDKGRKDASSKSDSKQIQKEESLNLEEHRGLTAEGRSKTKITRKVVQERNSNPEGSKEFSAAIVLEATKENRVQGKRKSKKIEKNRSPTENKCSMIENKKNCRVIKKNCPGIKKRCSYEKEAIDEPEQILESEKSGAADTTKDDEDIVEEDPESVADSSKTVENILEDNKKPVVIKLTPRKKKGTMKETSLKRKRVRGENRFRCDICQKDFTQKIALRRHVGMVHTENKDDYKCSRCDKVFKSCYSLKRHEKNDEYHAKLKEGPFLECNYCSKRFPKQKRWWFNLHIRSHLDIKTPPCKTCGKSFISEAYMKMHSASCRQPKQFKCEFCGRRFANKMVWKDHRRLHTGEMPYTCQICLNNFRTYGEYMKHGKRDHGARNAADFTQLQSDIERVKEEFETSREPEQECDSQ